MSKRPIVIDLEASGLHPVSFPLSVAWASTPDNIEHHLIRSEAAWSAFTHAWDPAAERLHGLSRALPDTEGKPALWVDANVDYILESGCRVVSNQRGYTGENTSGYIQDRVIEI